MASSHSSDSSALSSEDFLESCYGVIFHVRIGGIFVLIVNEIDLARLALSCHFALDVLCDKEGAHGSA